MTPDESPGYIGGYAIFSEPRLPSATLRARAQDLLQKAAAATTGKEAERFARDGLESLVDAFLFDRVGYAECFTQAHKVGTQIADRFGCPMTHDQERDLWHRSCGIHALHSRLGLSWAGTSVGECSICKAGDLECGHLPGRYYDGRHCYRRVIRADPTEVSVVSFPDDPRCYRLQIHRRTVDLEEQAGRPLAAGEVPFCTHCLQCPGANVGPAAEDIDQSLWPTGSAPEGDVGV